MSRSRCPRARHRRWCCHARPYRRRRPQGRCVLLPKEHSFRSSEQPRYAPGPVHSRGSCCRRPPQACPRGCAADAVCRSERDPHAASRDPTSDRIGHDLAHPPGSRAGSGSTLRHDASGRLAREHTIAYSIAHARPRAGRGTPTVSAAPVCRPVPPASASSPGCTRSRRRRCGSPGSRHCRSPCFISTPSSDAICPGPASTWTS